MDSWILQGFKRNIFIIICTLLYILIILLIVLLSVKDPCTSFASLFGGNGSSCSTLSEAYGNKQKLYFVSMVIIYLIMFFMDSVFGIFDLKRKLILTRKPQYSVLERSGSYYLLIVLKFIIYILLIVFSFVAILSQESNKIAVYEKHQTLPNECYVGSDVTIATSVVWGGNLNEIIQAQTKENENNNLNYWKKISPLPEQYTDQVTSTLDESNVVETDKDVEISRIRVSIFNSINELKNNDKIYLNKSNAELEAISSVSYVRTDDDKYFVPIASINEAGKICIKVNNNTYYKKISKKVECNNGLAFGVLTLMIVLTLLWLIMYIVDHGYYLPRKLHKRRILQIESSELRDSLVDRYNNNHKDKINRTIIINDRDLIELTEYYWEKVRTLSREARDTKDPSKVKVIKELVKCLNSARELGSYYKPATETKVKIFDEELMDPNFGQTKIKAIEDIAAQHIENLYRDPSYQYTLFSISEENQYYPRDTVKRMESDTTLGKYNSSIPNVVSNTFIGDIKSIEKPGWFPTTHNNTTPLLWTAKLNPDIKIGTSTPIIVDSINVWNRGTVNKNKLPTNEKEFFEVLAYDIQETTKIKAGVRADLIIEDILKMQPQLQPSMQTPQTIQEFLIRATLPTNQHSTDILPSISTQQPTTTNPQQPTTTNLQQPTQQSTSATQALTLQQTPLTLQQQPPLQSENFTRAQPPFNAPKFAFGVQNSAQPPSASSAPANPFTPANPFGAPSAAASPFQNSAPGLRARPRARASARRVRP